MKNKIGNWFWIITLGMVLQAKAADNELTEAEKKEGWTLLFDGKTLEGWNGNPGVWRVDKGMILGKAEKVAHNTFLISNEKYSDFILTADCQLIAGKNFVNSGIQYRSRVTNKNEWVVNGYQADMGDGYWGILYEEGGRGILVGPTEEGKKSTKVGDWFHYEISAIGPHLKHTVNGVVTVDYNDKNTKARKMNGIFALQYHAPGADFEAHFKNIKIKILVPAAEEKETK